MLDVVRYNSNRQTKYSLLLCLFFKLSVFFSSSSPRTISLAVFEAKLAEGASNALMYLGKKREGETKKGTRALVLSEAAEVNQVIPPVSSHQKQSSVTLVDFL